MPLCWRQTKSSLKNFTNKTCPKLQSIKPNKAWNNNPNTHKFFKTSHLPHPSVSIFSPSLIQGTLSSFSSGFLTALKVPATNSVKAAWNSASATGWEANSSAPERRSSNRVATLTWEEVDPDGSVGFKSSPFRWCVLLGKFVCCLPFFGVDLLE